VSCAVTAQTDCPFYQTYLKKGKDELQKGEKADFKKAIEAFSNAMIHCPAKADEARGQIVLAFDAINVLKKRAENDRIAAKQAQTVAQQRATAAAIAQKTAETEKQNAIVEKNKAQAAERKTKQVLDKIYFVLAKPM
jgi:hypothetical protein